MKELLIELAEISGCITGISACACLIFKPLRDKVIGVSDIKEGQKCLLRSEMLRCYYHHSEAKSMRQFEFENFSYLYEAYKALGGNSFIDKIHDEMEDWEVLP